MYVARSETFFVKPEVYVAVAVGTDVAPYLIVSGSNTNDSPTSSFAT